MFSLQPLPSSFYPAFWCLPISFYQIDSIFFIIIATYVNVNMYIHLAGSIAPMYMFSGLISWFKITKLHAPSLEKWISSFPVIIGYQYVVLYIYRGVAMICLPSIVVCPLMLLVLGSCLGSQKIESLCRFSVIFRRHSLIANVLGFWLL